MAKSPGEQGRSLKKVTSGKKVVGSGPSAYQRDTIGRGGWQLNDPKSMNAFNRVDHGIMNQSRKPFEGARTVDNTLGIRKKRGRPVGSKNKK